MVTHRILWGFLLGSYMVLYDFARSQSPDTAHQDFVDEYGGSEEDPPRQALLGFRVFGFRV